MKKDFQDRKESILDSINRTQTGLYHKINILQDILADVVGLSKCLEVWKKNSALDEGFRENTEKKIQNFMRSHTQEDCARFLHDALLEYYTRRIQLSRALEKISRVSGGAGCVKIVVPSGNAVEIDPDYVSQIRKGIARLGEIHTLLKNIIKGSIDDEALDNKDLCDEKYLSLLAKDVSLPSAAVFLNTHERFQEIFEEMKSATRQIEKLKKRVYASRNSPEAINGRKTLNGLKEELRTLRDSSSAMEDLRRMKSLKNELRKSAQNDSLSAKEMSEELKIVESRVGEHNKAIEEVRKKIEAQKLRMECPEADTSSRMLEIKKSALEVLKSRMVGEAKSFCMVRNKILKSIAQAVSKIATNCNDYPEAVKDVFRNNPPSAAEDICAMNYKIAFK